MSIIHNNKGTSLLELLLAVVLGTIAVAALSAAFPTNAKSIISNQQRWLAINLANAQIQALQSQPYAYVDATDPSKLNASNISCDCQLDDFSNLPSTSSQQAGTTFQTWSCVNFVSPGLGNTWPSQCPPAGDTGYKHIFVRVSWTSGADTKSTFQYVIKTRY
jgi:Tfp pilus assembly protein PilV